MGPTVGFEEVLRRLAIIDESFVADHAGLMLGQLPPAERLSPKIAALVRIGAVVPISSPGVCVEWSTSCALAAGASPDEVVDVLLAIAPVVGLARVVNAVPDLAAALGYDVDDALTQRYRDVALLRDRGDDGLT